MQIETKKPWQAAEIEEIGKVADVVQEGGGKLSTDGGDPGENRKEIGTEL
jgi:hypothetical protein